MKRITMVLVLLTAFLLVSGSGLAECVYARTTDSDYAITGSPGDSPGVALELEPGGGNAVQGDPDSMGDGLSRDLSVFDGTQESGDPGECAVGISELEEYLLYVLSQVQLLLW